MPNPECHWRAKRRRGSRRLVSTREYPSHRCRDLACQISRVYSRRCRSAAGASTRGRSRRSGPTWNDKPSSGAKQTQTRGRCSGRIFLEDSMGRLKSIAASVGLVLAGITVGFQLAAQGQTAPTPQGGGSVPARHRRAARAVRAVAEGLQDVGQVGAGRSGEQGHDEPDHSAEGPERAEAGQERDCRLAGAPRTAGGRGRRRRRRALPPRHERHHRRRHDRQLPGQLPRADGGAHRQLVPLLRERPDVQRRAGAGQPHARDRMRQGQRHELEGRHHRRAPCSTTSRQLKGVEWADPATPITPRRPRSVGEESPA